MLPNQYVGSHVFGTTLAYEIIYNISKKIVHEHIYVLYIHVKFRDELIFVLLFTKKTNPVVKMRLKYIFSEQWFSLFCT